LTTTHPTLDPTPNPNLHCNSRQPLNPKPPNPKPPQVLNAKPENVERESEIIAQSGRRGSVTISTNMAGAWRRFRGLEGFRVLGVGGV